MIKDISQVAGLDLGIIGNCRTAALVDIGGAYLVVVLSAF